MSQRTALYAAIVAGLSVGSAEAQAQASKASPPPAAISRVVACQSISDTAQRLACYDREVAAMASAQASGDLVTMDRQQVRRAKRSLFGFALPDLGVFGDDDSIEGDATSLETTIRSAWRNADGKWTFALAEGGRWAQIDSRELVVHPRSGHPIRIRRAAMGSYLANVNKQIAIRVRRIQ